MDLDRVLDTDAPTLAPIRRRLNFKLQTTSGFRDKGSYLAILSEIARVGNSADSGFFEI
jgi:hypothetical protein